MYDTVGKAMADAADQTVNLVKMTPHRVMRELYEQFIAYARVQPTRFCHVHKPDDDSVWLRSSGGRSGSALVDVCAASNHHELSCAQAPSVPEAGRAD